MAGTPAKTDPLGVVRSQAEAAARQRGASLLQSGLRLFEAAGTRDVAPIGQPVDEENTSPFALGRTYELLLAPADRRKTGSHLTPEFVARNLVAMLPGSSGAETVLDPAVGGAAFLLAAADTLVHAGAKPAAVLARLHGMDIDDGAVAVAEAALVLWGLDHGVEPQPLPQIRSGDGLLDHLPVVDRVVGNPPFLNQLRSTSTHTAERRARLRERWGELVGAYTDDAWLFLAAGLHALDSEGSMVMVQPLSILAARHAAAVRHEVQAHASLAGLWIGRDQVFDASVQVCGVVVDRSTDADGAVARAVGSDFKPTTAVRLRPSPDEWGQIGAATIGVPTVHLPTTRTVSDLASATAGFRDQFYGFVPYVSDQASDDTEVGAHKLVTVGMIDVLALGWGTRSFRFAKQPYERPVIDVDALMAGDPALGEWVRARLRPKLLMATQTRVVELWVDARGTAIPATPVLSVEPHDDGVDALWLLAAALSAPVMSAYFQGRNFGTALSINAMKLAARDVLAAPLPSNEKAWAAAAHVIRADATNLEEYAGLMADAYEIDDAGVTSWWLGRVPNRTVA